MNLRNLPEGLKIVEALTPQTDAAARTAAYVSLKNVKRAWLVVHITQAHANTVTLTPYQATSVAAGSEKVISTARIWSDLDNAAADALVRRTDAANYTTDAGLKHKTVVIEIDPATLDVNNGFDCVTCKTGGSDATNLIEAMWYLETDYPQATPPTQITD